LGRAARQERPGIPELFTIDPERLADTCVASVVAIVGVQPSS
jgi:hypothetical protein